VATLEPLERHDRTLRFLQEAIPWKQAPTPESLLDISGRLSVTIRLPRTAGRPQLQLAALAIANVLGRLPIGTLRLVVDRATLEIQAPPYRGATLAESLGDLVARLDIEADIAPGSCAADFTVAIASPWESAVWNIAIDGPAAYFGRAPRPSAETYHAVGGYTAASVIGGEVVRAWARCAASAGAGAPGEGFTSRTGCASDGWVDLRAHPAPLPTSTVPSPTIDWVSCGAVNQAVLAVLAASLGFTACGVIYDPGHLDLPDLNRSLLSFPIDIGRAKAQIGAEALGGTSEWRAGRYPEALGDAPAPWIVSGTDDPSVRPACQQLWPERLVVTATEDVFGYVAWHAPDSPDAFCAACQPAPAFEGGEPIPTSAPTSLATGTAAAALLLQLAAGGAPPHRTDLLTLRLDSRLAVEGSDPPPAQGCPVCGGRSR
jgi:hypothetical protein